MASGSGSTNLIHYQLEVDCIQINHHLSLYKAICFLCVSFVMTSEGKNKHYHRLCCYLPNTWVIKVTITLTLLRLQRQEYLRNLGLKLLLG